MEDRTDENCTKNYIQMCIKGEGGPNEFHSHLVVRIADSKDPESAAYSFLYRKYLFDDHNYYCALDYFRKCDTVESRQYTYKCECKIEEERREAQRKRGGGGGLILGATYSAAVIAAPVATVAATVAVGSLFNSDSD